MSTSKEALFARAYVSLYTRVLKRAPHLIELRDRQWVVDASQVIGWPAPEMPISAPIPDAKPSVLELAKTRVAEIDAQQAKLAALLKSPPVAVVWPETKPSNVIELRRPTARR